MARGICRFTYDAVFLLKPEEKKMNNEEKILEILSLMQADMSEMKGRMDKMEDHMDNMEGRMDNMEGRMDNMQRAIDGLRSDVDGLKSDVGDLRSDVDGVKVCIEVDINRKLNLLAEGHTALMETLAPKSRVEALEDDVGLLKSVVRTLSQDVSVLKKAQ